MKHNLFKIWSLTMVMVISISTTGLAINKHYCGGHEKAKAFFIEAEKCVAEVSKKPCKKHDDNQWNRKSCCEDHASFIKHLLNTDIEQDVDLLDVNVTAYAVPNQDLVTFSEKQSNIVGYVYRPPPLKKDINILFQTFLL